MDTRSILQLVNLLLAMLSIVPTALIFIRFIEDRKFIEKGDKWLNLGLIAISAVLLSLAVTNALSAFLSTFGLGGLDHIFSPISRFIINILLLIGSWMLYFVNEELERDK